MPIYVAGDPILDVYLEGRLENKRFNIDRKIICAGGATNVLKNIRAIVGPQNIVYPLHGSYFNRHYQLTRIIDRGSLILEYPSCPSSEAQQFYSSLRFKANIDAFYRSNAPSVLIVADYNKGMVNANNDLKNDFKNCSFDLGIFDSKHRTLNSDLLDCCKTTIWHATGDEYDWDYAQQFDYVVWTDGGHPVLVGSTNTPEDEWLVVDVPQVNIVDTCGAGDTLVAAMAAYMEDRTDRVDLVSLHCAAEFGVLAAQDVIQKKYTATTSVKLEK